MSRFDPLSVIERPPPAIPEYDKAGYCNPDKDAFVTEAQAERIVLAMFHPSLYIAEAKIPRASAGYKVQDQPGEWLWNAKWSNGQRQILADIGRLIDQMEKRHPDEGIKRARRFIYEEMMRTEYDVPSWVYDQVK